MKHIWLPTLRVWAQAHEMPLERGVTQRTGLSNLSEHRAVSSSGRPECHCHDDHLYPSYVGCQNGMHGQSHFHPRNCNTDDDCSRQHECLRHSVDDEFHGHGHGYFKRFDEPQHTCPICLSPIAQSDLTVLQWCMHRFCLTCIEKWSVVQRFCPLCKQTFHGWYYNIQSSSVFDKKQLAIKSSRSSTQNCAQARRERSLIIRPTLCKPLSRRRTLRTTWDHMGRVEECEGDEQALQWRASIYRKRLRAVPFILNSRVKVHQTPLSDPERRARIERRLEPWIRRELQAITGNWDHSLLVHVVLSLWIRFLSEKEGVCGGGPSRQPHQRVPQAGFEVVDALRQLEPFLQEKSSPFWHELRCFAESPYSLRAYDSVVKYEKDERLYA